MKSLYKFVILLLGVIIAISAMGQPAQQTQQPTMLPKVFAGWEQTSKQTGTDPATVDQASSRVLKEYGFTDFEIATYTQDDRKLTVKAARFQDASGAYGAFTFYRTPGMKTETVGTMAASDNEHVFFFRSNVLVMADFDRITAMSAAELRELAAGLPAKSGEASNLPTLPNYYPRTELAPNSAKYVIGPEALSALNAPVPASLVDFSTQPEILLGKYAANNADFMLISYPTPQIAAGRLRAIEAANPQQQGVTFETKRSGPLVAIVRGQISSSDAKSILARVNYEADVTWNENTGLSKRDNIGNLVIAASILAGVIFLISVGTGAIFGFGRIFLQKIFPKRFQAQSDEASFIKLNLKD
jgi:hypothetical protein